MSKHPMQPIIMDDRGVARFKANAIICWAVDTGRINLNETAMLSVSDEDHMQLAQLIGYSVSGFGDLDYADPEVVRAADEIVAGLFAPREMVEGDIYPSGRPDNERPPVEG